MVGGGEGAGVKSSLRQGFCHQTSTVYVGVDDLRICPEPENVAAHYETELMYFV